MSAPKRAFLVVEGQTEGEFANQVLVPHLSEKNILLTAIIVKTSVVPGQGAHRGGVGSYDQIREHVLPLLRDKQVAVTTLFDVYRFPKDLPGYPKPMPKGAAARAKAMAQAFEKDINNSRFFAGLATHEFEGYLFSNTQALAAVLEPSLNRRAALEKTLKKIREAHATPEEINDGPNTAPSKRLLELVPDYDKVLQGVEAVRAIGLAAIRAECPLFHAWMTRLENL